MKEIFRNTVLTALLVLFSATGLSAADQQSEFEGRVNINSVLATVDGEPITLLDVILDTGAQERELAGVYTGERLQNETLKLRRAVLQEIINRKLIYKEYQKEPFEIPQQMVEEIIDRHAQMLGGITREELDAKAKKHGTSINELRRKAKERIAVDVLIMRHCDRLIDVTPKDVYDEYMRNIDKWTRPGVIDFQVLQLNHQSGSDAAKNIAAKIAPDIKNADEAQFSQLVQEYSDGLNRENGGKVNSMELPKLRPEFQTALKNLKPGQVVGPIETPEAVFFLRLTGVHDAVRTPFQQVSKEIEKELRRQQLEIKRQEYESSLREKALIRLFI